jgi:hypothetical protein
MLPQRVRVDQLRPHETTDAELLQKLIADVRRGVLVQDPVIADQKTFVILDGHHRHAACKVLGIEYIPCILVDYESPGIRVETRRPDVCVSKQEVIRRGLSGDLYPPKTTRHIFPGPQKPGDP